MPNGEWWLHSAIDPRWNCNGHGKVGSLGIPPDVEAKLNQLTELYGEAPQDLEWGYMKD